MKKTKEVEVWYGMKNTRNYKKIPGLIVVNSKNFAKYSPLIQESIDSFNSLHKWDEMWDLNEAKDRLDKKHVLYLGTDSEGVIAHLWSENNYLYNVFVNPRRGEKYSVDFCRACLNYIDYEELTLYCDEWNKRSQRYAEKIGFTKSK